jgi:MFS family permease
MVNAAMGVMSAVTTEEQFLSWGWRVPFLLSFLLIFVGLYIRLGVLETPVFERLKRQGKVEKAPVVEVLRRNGRVVALSALVRTGQQAPYYIITTYVLTYGTQVLGLSRSLLLNLVMMTGILSMFTIPAFGYLSDVIGRRKLTAIGCVVMAIYPFLYFAMLDSGVMLLVIVAMLLSHPVHDIQYGPQAALISESFPGSLRYSGASLGYQLASITAGGPAPIIAVSLFETFRTSLSVAAFMSVTAVISLIALWLLPDRSGALDQE